MKRFGRRIAASLLSLILMAGLLPAAGAASTPQMGDINGDGYADSGDALLALRFAVDDYTLTDTQKILADVTYDGLVNAGDAVRILRYDVGLVDSLGKVPSESPVYFMLSTTDRESLKYDNEYYWVYEDAYINGERHELIVNYDWNNDGTKDSPLSLGALYRIDETTDGDYITKLSKVTTEMMVCAGEGFTVGDKAFWLDTAESETFKFDVDDSTIFVYGEYDYATDEYSFCEGNLKDMKDDDVTKVWVIEAEGSCARLVYIYAEANVPEDVPSANRVITYTVSVSNMGIYEALGTTLIEDYAWIAYVNGEEQADIVLPVKNDQAEWIYTGEGTVTEIHVNDQAETVTLYEINHYLGKVTSVRTDEKGEYITVKEFSEGSSLNDHTYYIDGFEVGDYVVYTQDVNADGKNVIGKASAPKIVTTEITAVSKDADTGGGYVYGGDVKYTYAEDESDTRQDHMIYDLDEPNMRMHPALNREYTLYLDPNGYVLAYKLVEEPFGYLYVKDSDVLLGEWTARVLLEDGTTQNVELDEDEYDVMWLDPGNTSYGSNIDGKIFKYTVNDKGEYDLDDILFEAEADGIDWDGNPMDEQSYWDYASINQGKAYITDGMNKVIVDLNTCFIDDVNETIYVGYDEVPNIDDAQVAYVVNGKIVVAAFILDGETYDTDSTYFMLSSTDRESLKYDSKYYWEYQDAYVNGEKQSLIIAYDNIKDNDSSTDDLSVGVLYKAKKTIDEDYITEIEIATREYNGLPNAVGYDAFWLTTEESKEVKFTSDANTAFVTVCYDASSDTWNIWRGTLADMTRDDIRTVWVVKSDEGHAELVYMIMLTDETPSIGGTTMDSPVSQEEEAGLLSTDKNQFLYVKLSDETMGEWIAKVLLEDGTTAIIELDEDEYPIEWLNPEDKTWGSNIDDMIFKYTIGTDGAYQLEPIVYADGADGIMNGGEAWDEQDRMEAASIHNGKAYLDDGCNKFIVDQDTRFIHDASELTYIGYGEVPNFDNAYIAYVVENKILKTAFILDGEPYDTSDTYFILTSTDRESVKYDSKLYWNFQDAYVNGENQELLVAYDSIKGNDSDRDILDVGVLYKARRTVDEDYITEVDVAKSDYVGAPNAVGNGAFWLTTTESKEVKFTSDANTAFVYVQIEEIDESTYAEDGSMIENRSSYEWSVFEGKLADMKDDDVMVVYVVESDEEYAQLVYIFSYIPKEEVPSLGMPTI